MAKIIAQRVVAAQRGPDGTYTITVHDEVRGEVHIVMSGQIARMVRTSLDIQLRVHDEGQPPQPV